MNEEIDPRDEFLALILGGCTPREAADAMGMPLSYFRRLRNNLSEEYDEDFAVDYDDLMEACLKYEKMQIREEAERRALRRPPW